MEMILEGSNSAETFPPGAGGVRIHRDKIREVSGLSRDQLFCFFFGWVVTVQNESIHARCGLFFLF